jgi:hypothetical protein
MDTVGWIHLKDVVRVEVRGFREITEEDKRYTQVKLVFFVQDRNVMERWYSLKETQHLTIDLKAEV